MPKNLNERTYPVLDIRAVNRFLFYPRGGEPVPPSTGRQKTLLIPVEKNVRIGGKCHLFSEDAPNILFFHGNGEIVSDYDDFAPLFLEAGFNFLPVDYRGYGFSTGSPSVTAMMRDSHVIFNFVGTWLQTDNMKGPLLVMGRSLGSAPALELAAHHPEQIAGLILDSGFAHTGPLLENLGLDPEALGFREEDGFGNLGKIRTFPNPTLIIHGGNDEIIGVDEGMALYEASPSGKKHLVVIPQAGHNDLFMVDPNAYRKGLLRLKEALNRD